MLQNNKIILILLFITNVLIANNTVHLRDGSSIDLIDGSKVTNTPYGFYIHSFGKSSIKAFDKIDISQYPDKKLFVGYGTFDKKDENCRYLDVPSNASINVEFESISTLGNKTYAASRNRMSYTQCKALVTKYSGFVYTPPSSSNYSAVLSRIYNIGDGGIAKDIWIGYSKIDCDANYMNDEGLEQRYSNYRYKHEMCSPATQYSYKTANSKFWYRSGSTDLHYCPIVINSPDYLRPIKTCAPWIRVEKTWKIKKNDGVFEFDGRKYDYRYMKYIIDYPEDKTICVKANPDASIGDSFDFTCNSYDDIKASPACIEDITLPQCHVNMCTGYAENTCVKTDSFVPFKDYDIGYISLDGVEKKVKVKDNKIINVYVCPPPPLVSKDCLKKEVVSVFPEECPNSKCGELASCLKGDVQTPEECLSEFPCEKNYGSVDNVIYNSEGIATALGGVCKDGISEIQATIKRKNSEKKICTEYNLIEETNTTKRSCVTLANKSEKIVSTSITKEDIYKSDPRCIRINNIDEARPNIKTIFNYTTEGFFKTSIQKAYIDGTSENNELNSTQYLLAASSLFLKPYTKDFELKPASEEDESQLFCQSTFADNWYKFRYQALQNATIKGYVYNKNGEATRNIKVYSSYSSILHSIADDFGANESSVNWGVAVFNENIKMVDYKSFNIKSSPNSAIDMTNFLNSLTQNTLVAIHTFDNPKTNVYDNNNLKVALSNFGADTTILSNLKTTSAYLLVGKKGSSRLSEKVSSIINANVSSSINIPINIPIALAVSDNSSCVTNSNFLQMEEFEPAYTDYNFNDIGVTVSDVNNKKYCFLGGNLIQGDSVVSSITNNSGTDLYYQFTSNVGSNCEKYKSCLTGEIIPASICKIHVSNETQEAPESNTTITSQTGQVTTLTSYKGSFVSEFNGYKDIFAVQEYTEGSFGYVSNYFFKLPKNNIVLLDEKEISPIVGQTPLTYDALYDYDNGQHTEITKNRTPTQFKGSYSGLIATTTFMGDNGVSGNLLVSGGAIAGVASIFTGGVFTSGLLVVMMFMGTQKWGWYDSTYKIYQEIKPSTKYVENIYGYDPRIIENKLLTWSREDAHSGTLKKSDYEQFRDSVISLKKNYFINMGFSDTMVHQKMTSSSEKNIIGWQSVNWYDFSAKKGKRSVSFGQKVDIDKQMNTIFMGAVNMLSIVVPYKGKYEIIAYDKNDNILATKTVQEQNFISNTRTDSGNIAQTYAKVQMATADNFNIATSQNRDLSNGSCLSSDFVEWGGGVSGAYYEKGVPDLGEGNNNCLKSNDNYVKEHAAVKITVRATDSVKPFTIKLLKPLPFPNRIVLVNLMQLENRIYECWEGLVPCTVGKDTNQTVK